MGQICCCASDCVSVVSLQDCTLQQSSTGTVETHPKPADRKKRSFKSFLRKIFKKTSSGQDKEEEQDTEDGTVVATASADDQTHHSSSVSDPEDDEYWFDDGFQDLVGEYGPAVQALVSSSASAQFTGQSEDDEYWCDSGIQDLAGDLSEWLCQPPGFSSVHPTLYSLHISPDLSAEVHQCAGDDSSGTVAVRL